MVANNVRRKGKKLWTDREGGSLIGYYEAPDGENEALFIADRIQAFLRTKDSSETQNGGAAVLYRTNSQSRLVEEALRRYGIAYTMVGGFSFYERAEIKDLLGFSASSAIRMTRWLCSAWSTRRHAASAPQRWPRSSGWHWRPAPPPGMRSAQRSAIASFPRAR